MLSGCDKWTTISAPLARSSCSASRSPFELSPSSSMPVRSLGADAHGEVRGLDRCAIASERTEMLSQFTDRCRTVADVGVPERVRVWPPAEVHEGRSNVVQHWSVRGGGPVDQGDLTGARLAQERPGLRVGVQEAPCQVGQAAVLVEHEVDGRSNPGLDIVHHLSDLVTHERPGPVSGFGGVDSGEGSAMSRWSWGSFGVSTSPGTKRSRATAPFSAGWIRLPAVVGNG